MNNSNRRWFDDDVCVNIVLEGGCVPTRQTSGSAAYDLVVPEDFVIKPDRNSVPLGFRLEFSRDFEALIDARSGFSVKGFEGYSTGDSKMKNPKRFDADVIQGKCDSDYRGIYHVIVKSNEDRPFVIKKGTRIAQLTFVPIGHAVFKCVESLSDSERGENGFGSTGTNN